MSHLWTMVMFRRIKNFYCPEDQVWEEFVPAHSVQGDAAFSGEMLGGMSFE